MDQFPTAPEFKDRLRLLREAHGWSQTELAARAGLGQSAISLWESGQREPNRAMICRLARAFPLTPDALAAFICPELLERAA